MLIYIKIYKINLILICILSSKITNMAIMNYAYRNNYAIFVTTIVFLFSLKIINIHRKY